MQKRGTPAVAVPVVSKDALPLASLPPVFPPVYLIRLAEPLITRRPMSDEPKRRLIVPGTYRVTANIVIEGDLTEEQLRSLFIPGVPVTAIRTEPEPEPEEETDADAFKRDLQERVRHMMEAYRERMGEPSDQLMPALGMWVPQFGEEVLRDGFAATAVTAGPAPQQRYEWLRAWLRNKRSALRRGRP